MTRSPSCTTGTAAWCSPRRCGRAAITGSPSEVVQETFLALWDRAERFDPSKGSLRGLAGDDRAQSGDRSPAGGRPPPARGDVLVVRRSKPMSRRRSSWLTTSGELIGSASPEPPPELALTSKETRAAIQDAIASLDPAERSVIELAYAGGLTQVEIASRLGWPIGTVKTRTRRALRHLRDRLEAPPAGVLARRRAVLARARDALRLGRRDLPSWRGRGLARARALRRATADEPSRPARGAARS